MDTIENIHRKLEGAKDLKSVVRTMKAMAASNIGQYEMAVDSLNHYYRTVGLGIIACFNENKTIIANKKEAPKNNNEKRICAIVFRSDQGLVGQFNDSLANYVSKTLRELPGKKEIWAVGERVQLLLKDMGYAITNFFPLPNSVEAITPLISQLLVESEKNHQQGKINEVYIFHNQQQSGKVYAPVNQRFLPLDEKWMQNMAELNWPTNKIPQVAGSNKSTLLALIHGYLFVSLFKACSESLACENSSRLAAMQLAEKNIEELIENLSYRFHSLRQSTIDEELFDVVSGFESLKDDNRIKNKL